MPSIYDEAYATIISKIAQLMFGDPILSIHIRLIEGWAEKEGIHQAIYMLDVDNRVSLNKTPEI